MFGTFGPYIGIGLTGKMKFNVEYQGDTETEELNVEWGNNEEDDMLKRFDFGLGFGAGIELKSITLGLSYDLGLANVSPSNEGGYKNRLLRFSVGYRFPN